MAVGHTNSQLDRALKNRHLDDLSVSTAKLQADSVTDTKTAPTIEKTLKFVYDGSSKTAGAKTLTAADGTAQTLVATTFIKSFLVVPTQAFTSSGSATIALGYTGTAAGIMAATAFDDAALAAATVGWENCATMGGTAVGLDGAHSLLLTIGTAAITAGACDVYVTYHEEIA
tara:strand:+ start:1352 stop:1867 length:516 start_codon:yes stop_codon:yes gene_type:complete